jgi:hypothetical protein
MEATGAVEMIVASRGNQTKASSGKALPEIPVSTFFTKSSGLQQKKFNIA